MSAKKISRAFAEGKVKQLRRMRQPLVISLPASTPRNPIARPAAARQLRSCRQAHPQPGRPAPRRQHGAAPRAAPRPHERRGMKPAPGHFELLFNP